MPKNVSRDFVNRLRAIVVRRRKRREGLGGCQPNAGLDGKPAIFLLDWLLARRFRLGRCGEYARSDAANRLHPNELKVSERIL